MSAAYRDCSAIPGRPAPTTFRTLPAAREIVVERPGHLGREGTGADGAALADDADVGILDIEDQVSDAEAAELTRPDAGPREQRGEREVPLRPYVPSFGIRGRRGAEHPRDLGVALDVAGERAGLLRSFEGTAAIGSARRAPWCTRCAHNAASVPWIRARVAGAAPPCWIAASADDVVGRQLVDPDTLNCR